MSEKVLLAGSTGLIGFRHEVKADDLGRIVAIVASTGFFNPAEQDVARELVDERLRRGPASGYHFVFGELEGETAGYACYGPIAGTRGSWDLYWIAVHRDFQRRGVGRALLGEAERLIAEQGGRRLYVETSSRRQYQPTRAFYLGQGYRLEARLTDFYAAGDNKLVYVKVL